MDIEELTGRELFVYLRNILSSAAATYGLSIIDTSLGPTFRVTHLANIVIQSKLVWYQSKLWLCIVLEIIEDLYLRFWHYICASLLNPCSEQLERGNDFD